MAKVITFHNQKGGSGKTHLAVNTAGTLAYKGYKVLLIDLDAQCNASSRLGHRQARESVDIVFKDPPGPIPIIGVTFSENLFLAPGSAHLTDTEKHLHVLVQQGALKAEGMLRSALKPLQDQFDFIVIDTPPQSSNLLVTNALMSSTDVIIPVDCQGPNSIENLIPVCTKISEHQLTNAKLNLLGIVANQWDDDSTSERVRESIRSLEKKLAQRPFKTRIRDLKQYRNAQWQDLPIVYYAPNSVAAENFTEFVDEILTHYQYGKTKNKPKTKAKRV